MSSVAFKVVCEDEDLIQHQFVSNDSTTNPSEIFSLIDEREDDLEGGEEVDEDHLDDCCVVAHN